MNFREIALTPGCQTDLQVYYTYVDDQSIMHEVTLDNDDIVKIRQYFNARVTGSIMQCAEIELYEKIPDKKVIDVTIKVKYGQEEATKTFKYRVKDSVYNADTKTYTHNVCDLMIDWMVEYEPLNNITYPSNVGTFFTKLCNFMGYTTSITLPNRNISLESDIYTGLGMSYRDVLDDICTANGIRVLKNNFQIVENTLGSTAFTIDDDILMNNNISINEHYGPVNVITMNRTGFDSAYYPSTLPFPIRDYAIQDNQMLNDDDRLDYAPGIYGKLQNLEFDTYDFKIVGLGGFEPLEQITISTDGKTFSGYVFNDEVTYENGGISESIYCTYPSQANTDYQYATADKQQDREAKIIVDKLNQELSLEGKTINLTADDIKIDSTYFKVDKNGNLIANSLTSNNATITGGTIKIPSNLFDTYINAQGIRISEKNNLSNAYIDLQVLYEGQLGYGVLTLGGLGNLYMDGAGTIDCSSLTAGNIASGQNACVGTADTTVYFGKTFTSAPNVVATPLRNGTSANDNACLYIHDITTTNFKIYHSQGNNVQIYFSWIAMN